MRELEGTNEQLITSNCRFSRSVQRYKVFNVNQTSCAVRSLLRGDAEDLTCAASVPMTRPHTPHKPRFPGTSIFPWPGKGTAGKTANKQHFAPPDKREVVRTANKVPAIGVPVVTAVPVSVLEDGDNMNSEDRTMRDGIARDELNRWNEFDEQAVSTSEFREERVNETNLGCTVERKESDESAKDVTMR